MARLILTDPACLSGSTGPAPILLSSPPARFGRVAPLHITLSARVPAGVPGGADVGRHSGAAGRTPAAEQRVHGIEQGHRGRAHGRAPASLALLPARLHGPRARRAQPRSATARALGCRIRPEVHPSARDARGEGAHGGFRVRPSPPPRPEPRGQEVLGFDRLRPRWTSDRHVLGRSPAGVAPTAHACGGIGEPQGGRHAVPLDLQPPGAEAPTLGPAGSCGRPSLILSRAGCEPLGAPRPRREVAHGRHPSGRPALMPGAVTVGSAPPGRVVVGRAQRNRRALASGPPRPGRTPARLAANRASPPGSRACFPRAWTPRATLGGRPSGRGPWCVGLSTLRTGCTWGRVRGLRLWPSAERARRCALGAATSAAAALSPAAERRLSQPASAAASGAGHADRLAATHWPARRGGPQPCRGQHTAANVACRLPSLGLVLWGHGQAPVRPRSGAPSGAIRRGMASPCRAAAGLRCWRPPGPAAA
jgi:hypothetical protein